MSGPPKPGPVQVEVRKHYYRITGDEGLEESSDCPPRTRWVSRGGQRGREEACSPGCCREIKGMWAEDGSLDLTSQKSDFRAHIQHWAGGGVEARLEGG